MSDTQTLPVVDAPLLEEHTTAELPAMAAPADPEPTTISMPVIGGGESVVVDDTTRATRSVEALALGPRRATAALTFLAIAAFATAVNEATVVAMSSSIAASLNVPVASIGLLATAFALTVVFAAIPLTVVTKRWSKRLTLSTTMAVWTVGVVIAATADSLAQLTAGRVVSAGAHALFWAIVAPTAASLFAPHLRGQTVTRVMVGSAAAGVVGTPLVTVLGTSVGWQAPYWGLAVLGIGLAVALGLSLPGVGSADATGGSSSRGDVPSLAAFLRVLGVAFSLSVGMSLTWTYIVPFYTEQAGMATGAVPVLFAVGGVVGVGLTLGVGRFLARFAVETVAVGAGALVLSWGLLALSQPWSAVGGQVLASAGWAISLAGLLNWAMRHTPWTTDMGASTYTVTMNAGGAIGPLVGGIVVATWSMRALPLVSLALTALAVVLTLSLDRHTVQLLRVPRRVRLALRSREAMRSRRAEWRRRTARRTHRPIAAAWWVGQQAARTVAESAELAGRAVDKSARATGRATAKAAKQAGRVTKPMVRAGKGSGSFGVRRRRPVSPPALDPGDPWLPGGSRIPR